MKKLLIIETITWKPTIEAAMEIALCHAEAGGIVSYHNLRKGLPFVEDASNIHYFIDLPAIRVNRARELLKGKERIKHNFFEFPFADQLHAKREARILLKSVQDTSAFLDIRYKGFEDIGWGALSSAVSSMRDSSAGYPRDKSLLFRLVTSSILVYDKVIQLIQEESPDQILVYNGRFATTLAALRASEACSKPWVVHERGCDKDHYSLERYRPHDMDARQDHMIRMWSPDKERLAHEFFSGRRERLEKDWHSYTKNQEVGKIPQEMNDGSDWLTLFTSSDDEMVAIGKNYNSDSFPDQFEAIKTVASVVREIPNLRLCVRIHPNIAKKSWKDRKRWQEVNLPGVIFIGPEDDTDSYALLDKSKAVVCYGSTIGLEATYWRRPALLLGRAFYDKLGAVTVARNVDDIVDFCWRPKIMPITGALIYGAYCKSFGEKFRYYQADDFHSGKILGVRLDDAAPVKVARYVQRIIRSFSMN